MKHTEQEILEKSKKVIKDLREKYYSDDNIGKLFFDENHILLKGVKKGTNIPIWNISIKSLFDNEDDLYISDETGEPLYYQNFNLKIHEIGKNSDGKYYLILD